MDNIEIIIQNTLSTYISQYFKAVPLKNVVKSDLLISELIQVFKNENGFLEKTQQLDNLINKYPEIKPLSEYMFDFLMIWFLSVDGHRLDPDYFDSPEWDEIENETLNKGTELLNILIYLKECAMENLSPGLDDFIDNFLLAGEDEFAEEHEIYELLIENADLVEEEPMIWINIYKLTNDDNPLKLIILPVMNLFSGFNQTSELVPLLKDDANFPILVANCEMLYTFASLLHGDQSRV